VGSNTEKATAENATESQKIACLMRVYRAACLAGDDELRRSAIITARESGIDLSQFVPAEMAIKK